MMPDYFAFALIRQFSDKTLNIKPILRIPGTEGPPPEPRFNELGEFEFYIDPPNSEDRHLALGRFMDAWSQLESLLASLLANLLNTDMANMPVLMNSLGTRGQLDVINNIGTTVFDSDAFSELGEIVQRIKEMNTKRNNIVHGRWLTEILLRIHQNQPNVRYRIYRVYDPSDVQQAQLSRIPGNKKEREKYYFSVARINAITASMLPLRTRLSKFIGAYFPIS